MGAAARHPVALGFAAALSRRGARGASRTVLPVRGRRRVGPNQVALLFGSLLAIAVAWRHGHCVRELRDAAVAAYRQVPAIVILLSVGALIGT